MRETDKVEAAIVAFVIVSLMFGPFVWFVGRLLTQ